MISLSVLPVLGATLPQLRPPHSVLQAATAKLELCGNMTRLATLAPLPQLVVLHRLLAQLVQTVISASREVKLLSQTVATVVTITISALEALLKEQSAPTVKSRLMVPLVAPALQGNSVLLVLRPPIALLVTSQLEVFHNVI